MDNKWTYQKDNPNLPLENTAAPAHISASPTESLGITKTIEAEYRKKEPTEFPQSYIVIFSGGKKTEAQYFTIIQENKAVFPRIRIDFLAEDRFDKGTESIKFIPRIFSYAFNKLEEYKQGASPDNPDSYYLVSDIDHFKDAIIAYKS